MKQIRVKELPVGYFVTDTHYQSGNKEFIKPGEGIVVNGNGWYEQEKSLGTKHIQLVAANSELFRNEMYDDRQCSIVRWRESSHYPLFDIELTEKQHNLAKVLRDKGKDFFIYQVTGEM